MGTTVFSKEGHTINVKEKKKEQGRVYGKIWREEEERRNDATITATK